MRYDRKAIFYEQVTKENTIGDEVPFYQAIQNGVDAKNSKVFDFDVAVTPFSNEEIKLYGIDRILRSAKVLCKEKVTLRASLIFLLDKSDDENGVFYKIPLSKDLRKVFLFNCEVKQIEGDSYDYGPGNFFK